MMILPLLLQIKAGNLTDYRGGDNPLLVWIAIGLVLLAIAFGAFLFIRRQYELLAFNQQCSQANLSKAESGVLKNFARRFHIQNPQDVIASAKALDNFIQKVAHYYEYSNLSEEELTREMALFDTIRSKLGFYHPEQTTNLNTSRLIPNKHPIRISYHDQGTKQVLEFSTEVVNNYEFFLGITPPDTSIDQEVFDQKRPRLSVTFSCGEDLEHHFDSSYVRSVNFPEKMWYITHSNHVSVQKDSADLDLQSTLMINSGDENPKVLEIEGHLRDLSNTTCLFSVPDSRSSIDEGNGVLVTFEMDGEPFTCRANVTHRRESKGKTNYRLNFAGLNEEEQKALVNFAHKEKKVLKQSSQEVEK